MPRVYNLFISHSWRYHDTYDNLIRMLDQVPNFQYKDYSIPKDDPIHTRGTDKELHDAIKTQMTPCHIVIIMAGVYATYSKWINKEIRIGTKEFAFPKPILAVRPWAQIRVSTVVSDSADDSVGWNGPAVVNKIRTLVYEE